MLKFDPTLYTDKPDPQDRLPKEMAVYELLDRLQIPYLRADHDVTSTIEDCHEIDKLLGVSICKNLFLCNRQKTNYYLLMMPGEKPFKTKDLSAQIGSARLSFGDAQAMEQYLDLTPGSVTVLALMNDPKQHVRLLIDRDVLQHEYIGCHPCINTSSLKIKTSDILEKFLPKVGHTPTIVDL